MGDRLQSLLDHPSGRARSDEEGVMNFALFAACRSEKIVKIVVPAGTDPTDDPADYTTVIADIAKEKSLGSFSH